MDVRLVAPGGALVVRWFNAHPSMAKRFPVGSELAISGRLSARDGAWEMANPDVLSVQTPDGERREAPARIIPRYPELPGVPPAIDPFQTALDRGDDESALQAYLEASPGDREQWKDTREAVARGYLAVQLDRMADELENGDCAAVSERLHRVRRLLPDKHLPAEMALGGGCTLYVDLFGIQVFVTPTDGMGVGSVNLPVPNSIFLIGLQAFGQFGVVDPMGSFSGISMTGGLKAVVNVN